MAKLGCPCGNTLWDGVETAEVRYCFVQTETLREHAHDIGFFETMYSADLGRELWRCCVCDRMMAFDNPQGAVSRYFRRIDAESISESELAKEHQEGICYNNLFFNDVESTLFDSMLKPGCEDYELYGGVDYEPSRGPFFTPALMKKEIFDEQDFPFRNWWYAKLYEDLLVLYSPFMWEEGGFKKPVKAWRRYEQLWPKE